MKLTKSILQNLKVHVFKVCSCNALHQQGFHEPYFYCLELSKFYKSINTIGLIHTLIEKA